MDQLIKLNVTSTTVMSKLVLPGMAQRKRGVVVNLSSGSGCLVVPLLSQYSATKQYVEQLTRCLADEYKAKNVHVQCQVPMFVSTKLAKIRHSSFMVPSPTTYARAAVANLGYETIVSPYWPHALQIWAYSSAPVWFMSKVRTALVDVLVNNMARSPNRAGGWSFGLVQCAEWLCGCDAADGDHDALVVAQARTQEAGAEEERVGSARVPLVATPYNAPRFCSWCNVNSQLSAPFQFVPSTSYITNNVDLLSAKSPIGAKAFFCL